MNHRSQPESNATAESDCRATSVSGSTAHRDERTTSRRIKIYIALSLILAAGALLLPRSAWSSSSEIHSDMEVAATVLALVTGGLALIRFYSRKDSTFLFLGTGFLGTAVLDGYHALVTLDTIAHLLPSTLDSLIPWSWMASRTFLSVLLCLSWILRRREQRLGTAEAIDERVIYTIVALLILIIFSIFALQPLPRAYFPALFLSRPEELIPGLFFAISLIAYLHGGSWKHDQLESWLVICLIFNVYSELAFMPFSSALFDARFDIAHLLKNAGYGSVFIGLLSSVYASFRQAHATAEELELRVAQRTAALQAANQDLEAFAYTVSHDLRQPLRSVEGFSSMLDRRYGEMLDQRGRGYLARIRAAAERMNQLIDGLLLLSRLRQAEIERHDFDMKEIAHSLAEELAETDTGRRVRFLIAEQLAASGDPRLVGDLLQNLMSNAWRFTARVPEAQIEIGIQRLANGVEAYFVRDNGVGFDEAHAAKLFQPFQRLHTQEEFPGLGIGLATAKRIVECHGGRIWAESNVGEGATFYFTLPRG